MSDGTEVVIGKKFILPRMQQCINRLTGRGAGMILFLCTGKFPEFSSKRLIIEPQKILDHIVLAFDGPGQKMGLMIPLPDQMEQAKRKYSRMKGKIILQAASPYAKQDEVSKAARALKRANPSCHCDALHGIYPGDEGSGKGDHGEAGDSGPFPGCPDLEGTDRLI